MAQAGELAQRVAEAPQPLVNDFTEREQSVRHGRPALSQSDLKQSPDDPSGVLRDKRVNMLLLHVRV